MVPWLNSARAGYGTFLGLSLARNIPEESCRVILVGGYDSAFVGVTKTYSSNLGLAALRRLSSLLQVPRLALAYGALAKRTLSALFRSLDVDVVLTNRDYPGLHGAVRSSGCRLLLWSMDDPMNLNADWLKLARDADHLWTHSYGSVSMYKERGITNVEWLPLAFDSESFNSRFKGRDSMPILFVGNNLGDRRIGFHDLIQPLMDRFGSNVHIFGRNWPPGMGCSLHGELPRERLAGAYGSCDLALGLHRDAQRNVDCSLNLRVFEALGLGALLLSDDTEGIQRLFSPGRDLVVSADPAQTVDLAEYYLREKDERQKIAGRGKAKVLTEHTMRHRAQKILDVTKQL